MKTKEYIQKLEEMLVIMNYNPLQMSDKEFLKWNQERENYESEISALKQSMEVEEVKPSITLPKFNNWLHLRELFESDITIDQLIHDLQKKYPNGVRIGNASYVEEVKTKMSADLKEKLHNILREYYGYSGYTEDEASRDIIELFASKSEIKEKPVSGEEECKCSMDGSRHQIENAGNHCGFCGKLVRIINHK